MTLTLEVNGTEFSNFTTASAAISMSQFVNVFSFGAESEEPQGFPVQVGDKVRVLVDEQPVITGFVEAIDGEHSAGSRSISILGSSKTVDIIDTTMPQINFATPISFNALISLILLEAGIFNQLVETEVSGLEGFKESEIIQVKQSQSVFSVLEQYARKRQVFLRTNRNGNITVTRNSGTDGGLRLTSLIKGDDNNVKSARVTIDHKDRYNQYIAVSQKNPTSFNTLGEDPGPSDASNQRGEVTDDDIRTGRTLIFTAENATDNDGLAQRAIWESNVRRARSLIYTAVVTVHSERPNQPWQVNQLIRVVDQFEGINALMLVDEITFNFSVTDGETTTLRCVAPDAYTLQASETEKQKSTNSLAGGFGG